MKQKIEITILFYGDSMDSIIEASGSNPSPEEFLDSLEQVVAAGASRETIAMYLSDYQSRSR